MQRTLETAWGVRDLQAPMLCGIMAVLIPQILAVQRRSKQVPMELDRLTCCDTLEPEIYVASACALSDEQVEVQRTYGVLLVDRRAAVRREPVIPRKQDNGLMAEVLAPR